MTLGSQISLMKESEDEALKCLSLRMVDACKNACKESPEEKVKAVGYLHGCIDGLFTFGVIEAWEENELHQNVDGWAYGDDML